MITYKKKPIYEVLNDYEKDAINQHIKGDSNKLASAIRNCSRGSASVGYVSNPIAESWASGTRRYYESKQMFLELVMRTKPVNVPKLEELRGYLPS